MLGRSVPSLHSAAEAKGPAQVRREGGGKARSAAHALPGSPISDCLLGAFFITASEPFSYSARLGLSPTPKLSQLSLMPDISS